MEDVNLSTELFWFDRVLNFVSSAYFELGVAFLSSSIKILSGRKVLPLGVPGKAFVDLLVSLVGEANEMLSEFFAVILGNSCYERLRLPELITVKMLKNNNIVCAEICDEYEKCDPTS